MARPLDELKKVSQVFSAPIICAGDIFDKWNSPPELINWAIAHVPFMYAIPGNHDLPLHNYDDLKKSAYATLCHAKTIQNIPANPLCVENRIILHGFPCTKPLEPNLTKDYGNEFYHLAVVHEYLWVGKNKFPDAPEERRYGKVQPLLEKYHSAVFGDNHKGFLVDNSETHWPSVLNCGGFMRRNSDQKDYQPTIGLLHRSGAITRYFLDISKDKMLDLGIDEKYLEERPEFDMTKFMQEIMELGASAFDFTESVKQFIATHQVSPEARVILKRAIEGMRR